MQKQNSKVEMISGFWCVWSLWCGGSTQRESSSAEVLHWAACLGQKTNPYLGLGCSFQQTQKVLFKDGKVLIQEAALVAPSGKSGRDPGHSYKQSDKIFTETYILLLDCSRPLQIYPFWSSLYWKAAKYTLWHLIIGGMMSAMSSSRFFFFFLRFRSNIDFRPALNKECR